MGDFRGFDNRRKPSHYDYEDFDDDEYYLSDDEQEYYIEEDREYKPYPKRECRKNYVDSSRYDDKKLHYEQNPVVAYEEPYYDQNGRVVIDVDHNARSNRKHGRKTQEKSVSQRLEQELKRRQQEKCLQEKVAQGYAKAKPKKVKCRKNPSASDLKACKHNLQFSAMWMGQETFYVQAPNYVPKESKTANDTRYAAVYKTPDQLRQEMYERSIAQGREANPYSKEAMQARQGLIQFLSCDFAPGKQDPYSRPVAKPMRGKTLAQAKQDMPMPRPYCW